MKTRFFCYLFLAVTVASSFTSCASDEPKRKKVVGPDSHDSNLPWNRPRSWEGNARYGGMVPVSR